MDSHCRNCGPGSVRRWYRNRMLIRTVGAVAVLTVLFVLIGGRAHAATVPQGVDVPGVGGCDKGTPLPQLPDGGLPGIFMEVPKTLSAPVDDTKAQLPEPVDTGSLYGTSGTGGLNPFTYDQGCGLNLFATGDHIDAWTDREFSSYLVSIGLAFTALGDSIDARAWDPAWITSLLSDVTGNAVSVIKWKVIVPFAGLGLLITTLMLLARARRGDTAGVMQAVAWSGLVIALVVVLIAAPTQAARTTQAGSAGLAKTLYGDGESASSTSSTLSPNQAATESIMEAVHYDGYLRRTFGSDDSYTAHLYGPYLLATTRLTWSEAAATDPSRADSEGERQQLLAARVQLIKDKQKQFDYVASLIAKNDPVAYQWVKGGQGATLSAAYETGFAFFASGLRMAAALLLILATFLLVGLALIWLCASPYLLTPRGEGTGRGLLNMSARSIGYAVEAALGSWLWSIYSRIALAPGQSSWWAFVLLVVGAFIFWTVLRPDRKALNLLSAGKVRGNGKWTRWATGRVLSGIGTGWVAGRAAVEAQVNAEREQWRNMAETPQQYRDRISGPWSSQDQEAFDRYYNEDFSRKDGSTPVPAVDRSAPLYRRVEQATAYEPIPAFRTFKAPDTIPEHRAVLPQAPPAGTTEAVDPPAGDGSGQPWYRRQRGTRTGQNQQTSSDNDEWWTRS